MHMMYFDQMHPHLCNSFVTTLPLPSSFLIGFWKILLWYIYMYLSIYICIYLYIYVYMCACTSINNISPITFSFPTPPTHWLPLPNNLPFIIVSYYHFFGLAFFMFFFLPSYDFIYFLFIYLGFFRKYSLHGGIYSDNSD
jgi:hypothetical protein